TARFSSITDPTQSDATQITVTATLNAGYDLDHGTPPALNFGASIGPLQALQISDGRVLLRAQMNAKLQGTGGVLPLSQVSANSISGSFTGDAQAILPISVPGGGNAQIDVLGDLTALGNIQFPPDNGNPLPNSPTPVNPASFANTFTITVHNPSALLPNVSLPNSVDLNQLMSGLDPLSGTFSN